MRYTNYSICVTFSNNFAAWGADSFAPAGASSGFDADEGFDSFLAMRAPPEVSRIYIFHRC